MRFVELRKVLLACFKLRKENDLLAAKQPLELTLDVFSGQIFINLDKSYMN